MVNKKFSFILAAGILSLAACGQEQPVAEDTAEPMAEEQENAVEEDTTTEEPVEEVTEEPEEEVAEEETAAENTPEGMSGTASNLLSN
ncbi:hypothetical protein MLE13_17925, partial [Planococcus halocryophilus]|nr:hypothetical protein [Planococcus halocryophilus]